MTARSPRRFVSRSLSLVGALLVAVFLLGGCSGESEESASDSQSQSQSTQQDPSGSAPGSPPPTVSSADVSAEQLQQVARIAASVQMGTMQDRMKMRKDMQSKYGNPQQMDSTQKAKARRDMRQRQMKIRKKQMQIMQREAKKEGIDPQTFRSIMRSARQDTTLRNRLRKEMKAQMRQKMQEQMKQGMQQRKGTQGQQ
jgi:hypothetical protein